MFAPRSRLDPSSLVLEYAIALPTSQQGRTDWGSIAPMVLVGPSPCVSPHSSRTPGAIALSIISCGEPTQLPSNKNVQINMSIAVTVFQISAARTTKNWPVDVDWDCRSASWPSLCEWF